MNQNIPHIHKIQQQTPDIRSDLLRIVYSSVPISLTAILLNSIILSYVQWGVVAHQTIITWLFLVNGFSVLRLILLSRFNALGDEVTPRIWEKITFIVSIISGLLWGSLAIWFMPYDSIANQVFTAFVLAGMCAGAVTTLSSMLSSSLVFILLTMLPLIISFLLIGTNIANAMAVMSVLFTTMIMMTSRNLNRIIRRSLIIRHERMMAEETIKYQANFDALTDLPNRRLVIERMQQEIDRSVRHGHIGAIMFIDLDHFKEVNDTMGHSAGDELLVQIAQRLEHRMRNIDTIARLGGDEFIVIVSEAGDGIDVASKNVAKIAGEVLKLFEEPFEISQRSLHITVSIGTTLFPLGIASPDQLLHESDVAMYEAKKSGRNTIRQFSTEMQQNISDRKVQVRARNKQ